jgi:hypothetical protein
MKQTASRLTRLLTAALVAAALGACTPPSPTVYKAHDGRFGYAETVIDKATWRVAFVGNRAMDQETVADYALYRAAEFALDKGYRHFALIDREIERRVERTYAYHHPRTFDRRESRRDATLMAADPFFDNRLVTTVSYIATLVIRPYSGASPQGAIRSFAARDVLARLGPGIRRR